MKKALLIACALLTGCSDSPPPRRSVKHEPGPVTIRFATTGEGERMFMMLEAERGDGFVATVTIDELRQLKTKIDEFVIKTQEEQAYSARLKLKALVKTLPTEFEKGKPEAERVRRFIEQNPEQTH